MPLTGAFQELNRFGRRIRRAVEAPSAVARALAPMFARQVRETFTAQTDLYGRAWKPLGKGASAWHAKHGGSPLVRTGRMRDSFRMVPIPDAIRVVLGTSYARFNISRGRGWLPLNRKLPIRWKAMIVNETERQMQRLLAAA